MIYNHSEAVMLKAQNSKQDQENAIKGIEGNAHALNTCMLQHVTVVFTHAEAR